MEEPKIKVTNNAEIETTFKFLREGEENLELSKSREAVLVLGNAGAGKSTFISFLTEAELVSIKASGGTYLVQDMNQKISSGLIRSKSIFPKLMVDNKTSTIFYDFPEFSDTRSMSYDVAITYFIKKVVDHLESVKLIFVINHASLIKDNSSHDFMRLAKHVTELIRDIDKFKGSIALVATKVNNIAECDGDNCILVPDNKIIGGIADFLQEVKQVLGQELGSLTIPSAQKGIYDNTIKFIDALVEKDSENYTKLGIFRRPNKAGTLRSIPLLQKERGHIADILYKKLNFTEKDNDDFDYTISEKFKNDIRALSEEINKNVASAIANIVIKVKEYYDALVGQIRNKIASFVTSMGTISANYAEAQEFSTKLSVGRNITSQLVEETKNLTSIEELAEKTNVSLATLGINTCEKDMLTLSNQGNYFKFLQFVSDRELNTLPWETLFQDIKAHLSSLQQAIQKDIVDTTSKISNKVNASVYDIVQEIEKHYQQKVNFLEVQKLPTELNNTRSVVISKVQAIQSLSNIQGLAKKIKVYVISLGIDTPEIRNNTLSISRQEKYLKFLQVISDNGLNTWSLEWIISFGQTVKYLQKLEKWYKFLGDLYVKFSAYEIQKDTQRYNLADEHRSDPKRQVIIVTQANFMQFLNRIRQFNILEANFVNAIEVTDLQLQELNQVLSFTLEHSVNITCPTPNKLVIKGDYVKFSDFIKSNGRLKNLCRNGTTLNSVNVFALNTVFIDTDLNGIEDKLKVIVIAPKWEVMGAKKIVLNGADGIPHNLPKASNGIYAENKGEEGKPGLPGGSAGSFFGIGAEFVNAASLNITANGGRGGPGQYGGDGSPGQDGEPADFPAGKSVCDNSEYGCYYGARYYGEGKEEYLTRHIAYCNLYHYYNLICYGGAYGDADDAKIREMRRYPVPYCCHVHSINGNGTNGGNGGQGGVGGIGGNAGDIVLVNLGYKIGLPRREMKKGNDGSDGYGGNGGPEGKRGYGHEVAWIKTLTMFTWNYWSVTSRNIYMNGTSIRDGVRGARGTDGTNYRNRINPEPAAIIDNPYYAINKYKSALRNNLNADSHFKKHPLTSFLNQLDSNSEVKKAYGALGFITELEDLEEQFRRLSKEDLIIFYQSLLNRISEYAQTPKVSERSEQYKKVLSYLYTAVLSKLYNLKFDSGLNLIIDINQYLELVEKNIKALKDLENRSIKVEVINRYKESYKANFYGKINEAKSFIDTQITSEIDYIGVQIDKKIDSLITETLTLQKQAKEEQRDAIKRKKELQNTLALRSIFSVFKIAGQVAGFLAPKGQVAGFAIGAFSTIGESLIIDDQAGQKEPLQLPSSVTADIKLIETNIKVTKDKKVADFNKKLDQISREIEPHPELIEMSKKVDNTRKELNKLLNLDGVDFEIFDKIEKLDSELKGELKAKERELKTKKANIEENAARLSKAIKTANQISQISTVSLDIYNKHKDDQVKLDKIDDAIKQSEEKFQQLKKFETKIYSALIPMLKSMRNDLEDVESKLSIKSQVALDVTKWGVQSALKDIKLEMKKITQGFQVQDSLARYIEKLEEVMMTLINIYDRIQNYQEQQNLANYIADISSSTANRIDISDIKLVNAVNHLELIIRSNLVLEQYETAINALKQWVFPCAASYLRELSLPQHLELKGNITNLTFSAVTQIEKIKSKVQQYKLAIQNQDEYMHSGKFNSDFISTKPFFRWENKIHRGVISKLLSGQEVALRTDVRNSPFFKDAIKFNLIGINFKSENQTIQSEINNLLKGFTVSATHLGNSYYRYNDKIYMITSPSQTIRYSLEKDANEEPIHKNAVYSKLKTGALMLSPYAMWKFKLINATDRIFFQKLEKYQDQVSLELIGEGGYINRNACPSIEDYYKADNIYNVVPWPQDIEEESVDKEFDSNEATTPKTFYPNQTVSTPGYLHYQDGSQSVGRSMPRYQSLEKGGSSHGFLSYLKSPLIWMTLSVLAMPLAIWWMWARNRNRLRQNIRREIRNHPVGNQVLALPLLDIRPVEAKQSTASIEKQEASVLSPKQIGKKRYVKQVEVNIHKKVWRELKLLTVLPHHQNASDNNALQATTQWLNLSQTEPTAQQTTTSYCQIETVEGYAVLKWLCGLFGKRSIVNRLNKAERAMQIETISDHPLNEIENRLKRSLAAHGNGSFISQKHSSFSSVNCVSSNDSFYPLNEIENRFKRSLAAGNGAFISQKKPSFSA